MVLAALNRADYALGFGLDRGSFFGWRTCSRRWCRRRFRGGYRLLARSTVEEPILAFCAHTGNRVFFPLGIVLKRVRANVSFTRWAFPVSHEIAHRFHKESRAIEIGQRENRFWFGDKAHRAKIGILAFTAGAAFLQAVDAAQRCDIVKSLVETGGGSTPCLIRILHFENLLGICWLFGYFWKLVANLS